MIEEKDLKSLTRQINIGGGSFGTGWVCPLKHWEQILMN